jgi:hypothetical protein
MVDVGIDASQALLVPMPLIFSLKAAELPSLRVARGGTYSPRHDNFQRSGKGLETRDSLT